MRMLLVACAALALSASALAADWRPERNVELIIAATPGGGYDNYTVEVVDGATSLHENGFAVVRAGSQSALARRRGDLLESLGHGAPEAWGLRARSKEQRFALELLLAVALANHFRKRIGHYRWRRVHYLTFGVWIASTAHGIGAGQILEITK